jgi:hypothetical protein
VRGSKIAPAELGAVFDRLTEAWSNAICAPRIDRFTKVAGAHLASDALAYDVEGPQARTAEGFRHLGPESSSMSGGRLVPVRTPGQGDLLSDGIDGVEAIDLEIPNGSYRMTLVTTLATGTQTIDAPFGSTLVVNGRETTLGVAPPSTWLTLAQLVSTPGMPAGSSPVEGSGGSVTLGAIITDGHLRLAFKQSQGASGLISGIILEPAARPSQIELVDRARDGAPPIEVCLETDRELREILASILASVINTGGGIQPPIDGGGDDGDGVVPISES